MFYVILFLLTFDLRLENIKIVYNNYIFCCAILLKHFSSHPKYKYTVSNTVVELILGVKNGYRNFGAGMGAVMTAIAIHHSKGIELIIIAPVLRDHRPADTRTSGDMLTKLQV